MSSLWQPEAERKDVELANVGVGVSASLSGPQLEVGDGGGREKEKEGWKRRSEAESGASRASLFGFARGSACGHLRRDAELVGLLFDFSQSSFQPGRPLRHLQGGSQQSGGLRPSGGSWGLRAALALFFGLRFLSFIKHLPVIRTTTLITLRKTRNNNVRARQSLTWPSCGEVSWTRGSGPGSRSGLFCPG